MPGQKPAHLLQLRRTRDHRPPDALVLSPPAAANDPLLCVSGVRETSLRLGDEKECSGDAGERYAEREGRAYG